MMCLSASSALHSWRRKSRGSMPIAPNTLATWRVHCSALDVFSRMATHDVRPFFAASVDFQQLSRAHESSCRICTSLGHGKVAAYALLLIYFVAGDVT